MTSVRAAGGLVVSPDGSGCTEVVVVHRPAYDDWTLPKGKLEPGEDEPAAALREVAEETGLSCVLGPELGTIEYVDGRGRDKTVRYWLMVPVGGALRPTLEVDEAEWVGLDAAAGRLAYARDRDVLARATAALRQRPDPVSVFLVRHGKAGDRDRWQGPDELRPLTGAGWKQAEALSVTLAGQAPAVLVSSPYARCLETLEPLAALCGLPLQQHAALAEAAPAADALALLAATATLGPVVACTHGDVQAAVVESLSLRGAAVATPIEVAKGSVWELSVNGGEVVGGRYHPPP